MEFRGAVQSFQLNLRSFAGAIVYIVPSLELVLSLALWLKRYRFLAALHSAVLFLLFIVLVAISWFRGIDLTCGCFGGGGANSSYFLIIARNTGFFLMAVFLLMRQDRTGKH